MLGRVGFPSVQPCVNYLSGASEIRGYEAKADWQHRKYIHVVTIEPLTYQKYGLAFGIQIDCPHVPSPFF